MKNGKLSEKQGESVKNHIVSFSGGRTSAYMVWLFQQKSLRENINVEFVYCDTGAEHPATYKFIKDVVKHYDINLTCLRCLINPEKGIGTTYKVVSLEECQPDLKPFKDMVLKYGVPSVTGPMCTREMKSTPSDKYCNEKYGRGNYVKWLGIRADEPNRIKVVEDQLDLFGGAKKISKEKLPLRYLGQISNMTKQDILDWWEDQPFNLNLTEELGNCVFCVKKGTNKIALAAKKEPEMAKKFITMVQDPRIPIPATKAAAGHLIDTMYRGRLSLGDVIESYKDVSIKDLSDSITRGRRYSADSCSESCESMTLDLFGK